MVAKFENLVFVLAYISIPLFFLQIINPHFYDIFTPLSELIMAGRQHYTTPTGITMHQYIFVYVMNGWAQLRNSGFMWEPAAYGMMLAWSFLCCMYLKRFFWHPRMIIYTIAIFTTFSLGTYTYAFLLLLVLNYKIVKKLVRMLANLIRYIIIWDMKVVVHFHLILIRIIVIH